MTPCQRDYGALPWLVLLLATWPVSVPLAFAAKRWGWVR